MLFSFLLALIIGLNLWSHWQERGRLSRGRWVWLGLCRLAGIAVLALAFWGMGLIRAMAGPGRPQVLAIVDASQSMARRDGDTDSRYQRALSEANLFSQQRRELAVKIVSPGDRDLKAPGTEPNLPETDIAAWIQQAAAQKPDAILLFSDGNNNTGQDPVAAAGASGLPIFTLGYGSSADSLPYIAEAWAEELVNLGEEAVINYRLSHVADSLVIAAEAESRPLVRQKISAGSKGWGSFKYKPASAGRHRLRLYLLQGKDTLDRRTVTLRVEKQKLRVAIWCGRPDWNLRFLQKALASDPDISLDVYLRKQGIWESTKDGRQLSPEAFATLACEAALLLNFRPEDLDPGLEKFLVERIKKGEMSAWFLGRGWDESFRHREIYRLWPLRIGRAQTIQAGLRIEAAYRNIVLSSGDNLSAGDDKGRPKPPLSLPRDCRQASEAVNVIAYGEDRGQRIPCWAWWYQGPSRVLQTTSEDLWIWELADAGFQRDSEIFFYSHTIRSLVKWLAGFREWRTRVGPQRPFYYQGQEVVLLGQMPEVLEEKASDVIWQATIEDGRGIRRQTRLSHWGRGQYQAAIQDLPAGDYRWRAELTSRGRVLDRSQGVFFIEPGRAEDQARAQQGWLLKEMADISQGRYWDRQQGAGDSGWVAEIKVKAGARTDEGLPAIPLMIGAFLLMVEWFWRRRWGLK